MADGRYDLVTVGGSLGGASLAKAMADHGARVLVLEREQQFRDRVRGEWMAPWGAAEAQALGIYPLLRDTCGHELPWLDLVINGMPLERRDFLTTTPQHVPSLAFYHPAMQEVVLQAAADAGADVRRGSTVRLVTPGAVPTVTVEQDGRTKEIPARLIVGSDGRGSLVRKWGGFAVQRDPDHLLVAGVFLEGVQGIEDKAFHIIVKAGESSVVVAPQGEGRVRAYHVSQTGQHRFHGADDVARFIDASMQTGAPPEWYTSSQANGPLATFDGAAQWVEYPYQAGVALVGDAAGATDPTFGQGLSLTVRDVRVLRDQLLAHEDWEQAGQAYATERNRYFGAVHLVDTWQDEVLFATGPAAEARRVQALPLLAQDPSRAVDHGFSGPELPVNETVRQRYFGEE